MLRVEKDTYEMWCADCKKVAEVTERTEYEDGHPFYTTITCNECHGDDITKVKTCPICGGDMGEDDDFCHECYEEIGQVITEWMEKKGTTPNEVEELIFNYFGI